MPSCTPLTLMTLPYMTLAEPVMQPNGLAEETAKPNPTMTWLNAERIGKRETAASPRERGEPRDAAYTFPSISDLIAALRTF